MRNERSERREEESLTRRMWGGLRRLKRRAQEPREQEKTWSSRIVLVLGRPIVAAAAAALALLAGCGHRVSARRPAPPIPRPIGWTETGLASWYGAPYDGRPAASGEIFDTHRLTAAHRTLPFDTWVEVTNLENGKRVRVRINDRGPFVDGRIIDLSLAAADTIDVVRPGIVRVRLKVIRAPVQDDPPEVSHVAAPATGEFAVQAGAFSDSARADAQKELLASFNPRVVKSQGDPPLWRVLIGGEMSREEAEKLAEQIRAAGSEAVIVTDRDR
jgi:rare lipoprotein A